MKHSSSKSNWNTYCRCYYFYCYCCWLTMLLTAIQIVHVSPEMPTTARAEDNVEEGTIPTIEENLLKLEIVADFVGNRRGTITKMIAKESATERDKIIPTTSTATLERATTNPVATEMITIMMELSSIPVTTELSAATAPTSRTPGTTTIATTILPAIRKNYIKAYMENISKVKQNNVNNNNNNNKNDSDNINKNNNNDNKAIKLLHQQYNQQQQQQQQQNEGLVKQSQIATTSLPVTTLKSIIATTTTSAATPITGISFSSSAALSAASNSALSLLAAHIENTREHHSYNDQKQQHNMNVLHVHNKNNKNNNIYEAPQKTTHTSFVTKSSYPTIKLIPSTAVATSSSSATLAAYNLLHLQHHHRHRWHNRYTRQAEPEQDDKCRLFSETVEGKYELYSPDFPNNYPKNINCTRVIIAPENKIIRLDFRNSFHIEAKEDCKFDYLEIRDGAYGFSSSLGKFCGTDFPPEITSKERYLWLHFHSDESIEYSGFTAVYEFIQRNSDAPSTDLNCTITREGYEGYINSTDIPYEIREVVTQNKIPLDCMWRIEVQRDWKIQMKFNEFKLSKPNDCEVNFLDIFPEETVMPLRIKNFCGSTGEGITSDTNVIHMRFYTEQIAINSTFSILFTAFRERGNGKCTEDEYDCEDATCIAKELKCNKRDNCKFRWDEEYCGKEESATSEHMTIIITVFGLILGGMIVTFLFNCVRKIIHDQKIIRNAPVLSHGIYHIDSFVLGAPKAAICVGLNNDYVYEYNLQDERYNVYAAAANSEASDCYDVVGDATNNDMLSDSQFDVVSKNSNHSCSNNSDGTDNGSGEGSMNGSGTEQANFNDYPFNDGDDEFVIVSNWHNVGNTGNTNTTTTTNGNNNANSMQCSHYATIMQQPDLMTPLSSTGSQTTAESSSSPATAASSSLESAIKTPTVTTEAPHCYANGCNERYNLAIYERGTGATAARNTTPSTTTATARRTTTEHIRQSKESKLDEIGRRSKTRSRDNISEALSPRKKHSQTSLQILDDVSNRYYREVVPLSVETSKTDLKEKEHSILRHHHVHDMIVQTSLCSGDDNSSLAPTEAGGGNACDMGCQTRESLFATPALMRQKSIASSIGGGTGTAYSNKGNVTAPPRFSTFGYDMQQVPTSSAASAGTTGTSSFLRRSIRIPRSNSIELEQRIPQQGQEPMQQQPQQPAQVCHHHHQHQQHLQKQQQQQLQQQPQTQTQLGYQTLPYGQQQQHAHHQHHHMMRGHPPLPQQQQQRASILMPPVTIVASSVKTPAAGSAGATTAGGKSSKQQQQQKVDESKVYIDIRNSAPDVIIMTSH